MIGPVMVGAVLPAMLAASALVGAVAVVIGADRLNFFFSHR
jgi:hypothetical protein